MNELEKLILDRDFVYDPPYFYNNSFALRCELGIGNDDTQYVAAAKSRAAEIFGILFERGVDLFFFDNYIYDYDYSTDDDIAASYANSIIAFEKRRLRFALNCQKKYRHTVVRGIAFDDTDDGIVRRNRIVCYPNAKLDAQKLIGAQIENSALSPVHFVSLENDCIFTVYDDRGCDVVFFDEQSFRKYYSALEPYFLDYDRELMRTRLAALCAE